MSEYAKNIQTIEDLWRKRIELQREGGGRMSEYIYYSDGKPLANEHREISLAREEIVRCRDCRYYNAKLTDEDDGTSWCCIHAGYAFEDDFCAWAERREP